MTWIFWSLIFLIIYCYFGYPALLWGVSKIASKQVSKAYISPTVSVVLSVWNEQDVIQKKIENLLNQDYPKEKLEILIGSDGSTDRTNDILQKYKGDRLHIIQNAERRGKMAMLNELVEQANHEMIVFTDARQVLAPNAIKELVANFSDPAVGCASGELVFSEDDGATARGINLYWNYEKFIRRCESKIHSMLGATGAICAIRRALFVPIPTQVVLDDMFVPFKITQKGYRAVFDESAKAYDAVADSPREEHRRKVRTLFGNYQIFLIFRSLFNPLNSPVAIQLFSHKFLRVIIPFFMIAIFFLNLNLLDDPFYRNIFILQVIFYGMAITGGLARYKKYGILKLISRVCYIPYVFCLLNFSAFIGFMRFIGSRQDITWEKARG